MSTFSISLWFTVEADDIDAAYKGAGEIGNAVESCDEWDCSDSGEIAVEEVE